MLQCNMETRTRESAGRCGAWGMLPPIRLEDRDSRPCTLRGKGIVFGVCNFKFGGFCSATYWADVNRGVFSEHVRSVKFYDFSFYG